MKVAAEKLGNNQMRLRIEISAEEVDEELEHTYRALRTRVSVPGFRKGRVPSSILKARFAEYIKSESLQNLVPPAYEQALDSEQLIPLNSPEISPPLDQIEIEEGKPVVFEATIDVQPDFILPNYEELVIDKTPADVPRDEVEAYIRKLQAQHATYVPLEANRPAQRGDSVRIDWECFVDNQPIKDGTKRDVDVEIGQGTLLTEIEEALIGMPIGSSKRIEVDFDRTAVNSELAGKRAVFHLTLHALTEKQLPELDNEFAKDLEYEYYDQLYGAVWNNLVEERKNIIYQRQREEVLQQLIEKIEINPPESLIDRQVQLMTQNIQRQLRTEGKTPEQAGVDLEKLPSELRGDAIRQIKQAWIFDTIAEEENIGVMDDELDIEIRRRAESQNRDPQKYASLLKANNRLEEFREQLRNEKIFTFLIQQASEKQSLIIPS